MVTTRGEHNWEGLTGHIGPETLKEKMPAPSDDTLILFSGTKLFNEFMFKHLPELGYSTDMIVKF